MSDEKSDGKVKNDKTEFSLMCRHFRVDRRLKQREVATAIGVKTSTYGNVEYSPHRVIREDRVHALSGFYKLDEPTHNRLMAAWRKLPLSEHGIKNQEMWKRKNAQRNRAKLCLSTQISLVEVLSVLLGSTPDPGSLCSCSFERSDACEICAAFEILGLPPYTTIERAVSQLERLAKKLEAERAAGEKGATQ